MADSVAEQIAALQDDDWAIREEAAVALGAFRDPRAVEPLVGLLRDSDRAVREAAISALTAIGGPSVPVLGLCLSDPQLGVQEAASSVLASIADERVIDPLIGALANSDWIVRMHATKALGRIKAAGAIDPLIPLLQDKVKAVREEATVALAKIGDAALSSLLDALKHPEWLVRLHAWRPWRGCGRHAQSNRCFGYCSMIPTRRSEKMSSEPWAKSATAGRRNFS
jgi:hypothetical protein